MSRGLRNHNPLNIRKSADRFTGEVEGEDKDFKTFESDAYGYRAAFVILYSYLKRGLCTIREIVSAWAPSKENDVKAYIDTVCRESGIDPDVILTSGDGAKYIRIVAGMSLQENGVKADENEIKTGFDLQKKLIFK